MGKKKKKQIDWEKGEKLFRLGQLSAAEIGRQLGCPTSTVTRHMKSCGVTQDKTEEVRARTRAALAGGGATQRNATLVAQVTEEDIEQAVGANVALVLSHRKDIQKLAEIEQKFLKELGGETVPTKLYITQYQGDVVTKVVELTIAERASALQSLANVQSRRIGLGRQAFNITDGPGEEKEVPIGNIPEHMKRMIDYGEDQTPEK